MRTRHCSTTAGDTSGISSTACAYDSVSASSVVPTTSIERDRYMRFARNRDQVVPEEPEGLEEPVDGWITAGLYVQDSGPVDSQPPSELGLGKPSILTHPRQRFPARVTTQPVPHPVA